MTDDIDTSLLTDAAHIIEGRAETHGAPERSFQRIATHWTMYLNDMKGINITLTKADVAELMARLKLARAQDGEFNDDDYRDALSYLNFAAHFRSQ